MFILYSIIILKKKTKENNVDKNILLIINFTKYFNNKLII